LTIVLLPQLATILKAHRKKMLAGGVYRADGYVFCTQSGAPTYCRNVAERGIDKAAKNAGLNPAGKPKLSAHDLRHSFAFAALRQQLCGGLRRRWGVRIGEKSERRPVISSALCLGFFVGIIVVGALGVSVEWALAGVVIVGGIGAIVAASES
jgi:hypothetical protein